MLSSLRAVFLSPVLLSPGRPDGMASGKIGDGQRPGARNRLPNVCRLTSRTI